MKKIILIAFVLVSVSTKTKSQDEIAEHNETVSVHLSNADSFVFVSVYMTEWIPPEKDGKGKIISYGRIVNVFKGPAKVGDKLRSVNLVENPPKWLRGFSRPEESLLYFVIADLGALEKNDNKYDLGLNAWIVEYDDKIFSSILIEKAAQFRMAR